MRPTYIVDAKLKEWATDRQGACIDAVNKHRSIRGAARALGINQSAVGRAISAATRKAAI